MTGSIYDLGSAAIPILETELLKERSEHQEFRATVAAALNELQTEWLGEQIAEPQSAEESGINARIQRYAGDLNATIAALGLGGTEKADD